MVGAGLLYGAGEDALEYFFRSAWLQDPKKLPYPGNGENLVPSIHVNDLATFVVGLAESPPEAPPKKEPTDNLEEAVAEEPQGQYFFAFDGNKDRTLLNLVQGISEVVGSGEVQSMDWTNLIKPKYDFYFKLNLWALPSPLLLAVPAKYLPGYEEPVSRENQQQGDDGADAPQDANESPAEPEDPAFEWHAKGGIVPNGRKILSEFTKSHSMNS